MKFFVIYILNYLFISNIFAADSVNSFEHCLLDIAEGPFTPTEKIARSVSRLKDEKIQFKTKAELRSFADAYENQLKRMIGALNDNELDNIMTEFIAQHISKNKHLPGASPSDTAKTLEELKDNFLQAYGNEIRELNAYLNSYQKNIALWNNHFHEVLKRPSNNLQSGLEITKNWKDSLYEHLIIQEYKNRLVKLASKIRIKNKSSTQLVEELLKKLSEKKVFKTNNERLKFIESTEQKMKSITSNLSIEEIDPMLQKYLTESGRSDFGKIKKMIGEFMTSLSMKQGEETTALRKYFISRENEYQDMVNVLKKNEAKELSINDINSWKDKLYELSLIEALISNIKKVIQAF